MTLRTAAKDALIASSRLAGVEALGRHKLRSHALVLCYHGVVREHRRDRFGYEATVSAEEFGAQVEFIASNFRPITADDLLASKNGGPQLPERAALVTFDDGFRNNLTVAAEILKSVGVPAIFFMTTGYIGTRRILWPMELTSRVVNLKAQAMDLPDGGRADVPQSLAGRRALANRVREMCKALPHERAEAYLKGLRPLSGELPVDEELDGFLTWDEVRSLRAQGFTIGAHTVDHTILTRISSERRLAELRESKQTIERELGEECRYVAYPNGGRDDVSGEVFEAARSAGFRLGFTLAERFSAPAEDPFAVSRICVQGHLPVSYFKFQVSGVKTLLGAA